MLPAVSERIGGLDIQNARLAPVLAPPLCRMEAPQIACPPLTKMWRNGSPDLPHQTCSGYSYLTSRLYKPGKVVQIEIVGPKVNEGVNTDHGIKKLHFK